MHCVMITQCFVNFKNYCTGLNHSVFYIMWKDIKTLCPSSAYSTFLRLWTLNATTELANFLMRPNPGATNLQHPLILHGYLHLAINNKVIYQKLQHTLHHQASQQPYCTHFTEKSSWAPHMPHQVQWQAVKLTSTDLLQLNGGQYPMAANTKQPLSLPRVNPSNSFAHHAKQHWKPPIPSLVVSPK